MGTRPAATSMVISMTRRHSAWVRVGVSPVVPQGTRKSIPDSICQATSERSAFSSSDPSARNGVTSAVPHPRNLTIALTLQLREDFLKLVKSALALNPLGGTHRAFGKSAEIVSLVSERNPIRGRHQLDGVGAHDFALAQGGDGCLLSAELFEDLA